MLAGFTLTLGAHTVEHAAVDFLRQIDGLDPHIDHLDAQLLLRHPVQRSGDVSHQRIALTRDHLVQGALTELVAQTRFQTPQQALVSRLLEAGSRGVETRGIRHPPLGEGIHHHRLLLQGEETLGRRIEGQQTAVELAHLVDVRNLEMQARLDVGVHHTTEALQHGPLGLLDDVHRVPQDHGHDHARDQGNQRLVAHQRLSLERRSRCCRSFTTREPKSGVLLVAPGAVLVPVAARLPPTILSSGR
ncbi:hypothetical protein D3C76_739490 [compost metagenome]